MKMLINICRVVVGLLFIFSGLIKANDPIGLSFKMQEFFELWGMTALNNITLILAIVMIAFEIIAGIALLLGWRTKLVSWLLLLLIIFFTFLTGYAYLSGKFSNCGCFGDCIPISSKTSFIKDVILLVLILFIFFNQKYIPSIFSNKINGILIAIGIILSFGIQWYTLQYLPVLDCLPFKKGSYIPDKMKMPMNAIPDSTEITFVYEKAGKKMEFTADNFPADFDENVYKFISRYDKIIRPGENNIPEIRGFDFSDETGKNYTADILAQPNVIVLFSEDLSFPVSRWQQGFEKLYHVATQKKLPVFIITSTAPGMRKAVAGTVFKNVPVLDGDRVTIRMAARTNPTVYIINRGKVYGKWSYKNFDKAIRTLEQLPAVPRVQKPAHTDLVAADSLQAK